MAACKCGLSNNYPECDGMHNAFKHEKLREAMRKAFEDNKHLLEVESNIDNPWD
jgi:CDGSH-type Zn-finger protein